LSLTFYLSIDFISKSTDLLNKEDMAIKTMTCKQLGGACDVEFQGERFEEIAEQSKKHGMEMFQQGDEAHLEAMKEMQTLMQSPEAMMKWFEEKKKEFDS
jgi:hypothetical protein